MSQQISLKEAERKVFVSAFQDGLWDILIGCVVLMFAVVPYFSRSLGDFWSAAVFVPFWALAFLAVWLIRKHIVTPRVGVVKFGSWRKSRLSRCSMVMLVVCLVASVLGAISALSFRAVPGWVPVASFSLIILVAFTLAAYLLGFTWLYIYGLLIALSPLVGEWLYANLRVPHHGFPITFGITAGTTVLVGLIKFVRLVQAHPLPSETYDG